MTNLRVQLVSDKETWEEMVLSFSPNIFLQSWQWKEFSESQGNKVFCLGLFQDRKLIGGALVEKIFSKRGIFFTCPGGPLIDWNGQFQVNLIFDSLFQLVRRHRGVFLRVRPTLLDSPEHRTIFKSLGFIPAPMHLHAETTLMLDITPSEENILSKMRKNTRYYIKRSLREGMRVQVSTQPDLAQTLYNLQMETVRRQKFTPFPPESLRGEFLSFSEERQAFFVTARQQNEINAIAMIIAYGDTAVYHYGGSKADTSSKVPSSYLLLWEAIKEAKKGGCKYFNFWGIAKTDDPKHPWAGLTRFKRGFGGQRLDWVPAHDKPMSILYWPNYIFETFRRLRRGL